MTAHDSPEAAAADLAGRVAVYRLVKVAALGLRERLEQRQRVWPAGSGVLRDRPQLAIRERRR